MKKFAVKAKHCNIIRFDGGKTSNQKGDSWIVEGRSKTEITQRDLEKAIGKQITGGTCGPVLKECDWEITEI